ncbi:2-octaprenyl-6-methoxyphenyl hydroxylase [Ferrimonas sediminicola]|uniref:2-octaprenyl-6-methoxyphenyl hydroxylase n=1 Tax=Ferrimonas sediminicola TaxID=2569538 RepID=A0A4V6WMN3_9GAMM|nr:2-octaprenyl-6-methoxyphenyl hydroxylase [Ferrimonas sediminicola]TKB48678.1 2-octaprenyl-6-methoxyphenyl hydroxylase [Ferrimonas sediminicola]
MEQFDIAIVGGGMAGATLALALAGQEHQGSRWRIALIEAHRPQSEAHPGFDSRAIALAHGSVERYRALGLWRDLAPHAAPIRTIHVSDRGHWGQVTMTAAEQGVDALGQVVELERVGPVLHQALEATGVTRFCPDALATLEQQRQHCALTLESGRQLTASLVVAADGGPSLVRQQLKLPVSRSDYGQVAVIANVELSRGGDIAYERFTDEGPLALLPMTDGRYSLVWVRHAEEAEALMALEEEGFRAALQSAFGYRLGEVVRVGRRVSYPLALQRIERPIHHRVALIGNAAQTLHPIAGQGFNLGMRDALTLADRLGAALERGEDPGGFGLLDDYLQGRKVDVDRTVGLTNGLVKLFSNNNFLLQVGRNLGLIAMDLFPSLGQQLVSHTLGQGQHRRSARW